MTYKEYKEKVAADQHIPYYDLFGYHNTRVDKAYNLAAELWQAENLKRIEELEADKERLDWVQKIMTPKETYCEVYFAGLRNGLSDATKFQIESNPWEHFQSIQGESVRDVIDKAKELLK